MLFKLPRSIISNALVDDQECDGKLNLCLIAMVANISV